MNLSTAEVNVLASHHGNTRECRVIRQRLQDDALKYCPGCHHVKSLTDFSTNGSGRYACKCRVCSWKTRQRPTGYIPVTCPERIAETTRLYVARHHDRVKARDRVAYHARRDTGMTGDEASWHKTKTCNSCRNEMRLAYFGIDQGQDDGHNRTCRTCRNRKLRRERRQVIDIRQRTARGYIEPDPADLLATDFPDFE